MATNKPASPLMSLPLEVRHAIFKHLTVRDVKPKKILRHWFEKKEVKELMAKQVAADPTGPAPRAVYDREMDVDSDVAESEDDEDQDSEDAGGDSDSDSDSEDDEDGDEDEGNDDDGEDNSGDEEAEQIEEDEAEAEDEDAMEEDQAQATSQPSTSTQAHTVPTQASTTIQGQTQDDDDEEQSDEDIMKDDDEDDETSGDNTVAQSAQDDDGDEPMAGEYGEDEGQDNTTTAPPPPPLAPVVRPSPKWRHIPNFMRITHCPPVVELLLASKQLNEEAKNWFYDVARLRINATGSFAHTSFFEEAFSQITDAAFSPMENIRKVDVMFVWDTTWIRSDQTGAVEAIFPALLRQRSDFVHKILSQAPDLTDVTIHWHDSARDDESTGLMLDILAAFHTLNANVTIEEHYIAADAKPHKRSIAGQRRVEFQQIADGGLARLF